jgi:selenocysteine lyase/cysteine desulfurase
MFSLEPRKLACRENFSSLVDMEKHDEIFFENAGGSQIPDVVIDTMCDYMKRSYVQLGAGYSRSNTATSTVADARSFVLSCLFNGDETGDVIFGSNTSQMMNMLAQVYAKHLQPGDEIGIAYE